MRAGVVRGRADRRAATAAHAGTERPRAAQGGLGYGEASSFSLKPLQLLWTLLPTYGLADLKVVFGTRGYTEYVAYVGLIGLGLAAWAALRGLRRDRDAAWTTGLLLAVTGAVFGAGALEPGLLSALSARARLRPVPRARALDDAVHAGDGDPGRGGAGQAADALRRVARAGCRRWSARGSRASCCSAALSLPHTQPTAPQAVTDVRSAPAYLLTDPDRASAVAAAVGRFLSMSATTYDPGDLADYRRIMTAGAHPQLDEWGFYQLIGALKTQEIIAPNLALYWRIPSLDGFDGGVLPLRRYLDLLTLFVPADDLVPDGRLREQVRRVPPAEPAGDVQRALCDHR